MRSLEQINYDLERTDKQLLNLRIFISIILILGLFSISYLIFEVEQLKQENPEVASRVSSINH